MILFEIELKSTHRQFWLFESVLDKIGRQLEMKIQIEITHRDKNCYKMSVDKSTTNHRGKNHENSLYTCQRFVANRLFFWGYEKQSDQYSTRRDYTVFICSKLRPFWLKYWCYFEPGSLILNALLDLRSVNFWAHYFVKPTHRTWNMLKLSWYFWSPTGEGIWDKC